MCRHLRAGILIAFGMLIISLIGGCGDDDPTAGVTAPPQSRDDVPPPPVVTVVVDPGPGSIVPSNAGFTLTFSKKVVAVKVNGIPASGSGFKWKAAPILGQGEGQILNVQWVNQDGSTGTIAVGPYAVED